MHPSLENEQHSDLTEDEILQKIHKINDRLIMAGQRGNHQVITQLYQLRDHYQNILDSRIQQEILEQDPDKDKTSIDIDWPDPAEENSKKPID